MSTKIYPIGIQNFEKIRNDGYFYIDKTALMYQMVKTGSYYFLSRPRRFGKSLLISTLEAYFQGKKELFAGLAVERLEKDWIKYPILHLDLNIEKYDAPESLYNILEKSLTAWEKLYGAEPSERSFSLRFAGIIERACKQAGQRVVILVDEYDKPMLQAIGNEELQKQFYALNAAYAKKSLVQEFKKQGFNYKPNDHFTPTTEEVYCFFMVGRSKDRNEDEPVAQIKFTILKDGTIITDSDYLPNDVNERAHDAMDVLEQLLGNKRVMTKKPVPAKYLSKMKPRRVITLANKNK